MTHSGSRRDHSFKQVLGFTFRHWGGQFWRCAAIVLLAILAAIGDVFAPLYTGRLVDALAQGHAGQAANWAQVWHAFACLVGIGAAATLLRQAMYRQVIDFTLKMMYVIAASAFHRVQRFSTDWQASNFAGSTVRKITRGVWALDLLNDTLLIALLPSLAMLLGASLLLGLHWSLMGLVVGLGSLLFIAVTVGMSLAYVAPAAKLANAWDTQLGGVLADAVSCNPVVKAFGAEVREEARLARVLGKWQQRTRRGWRRGTSTFGLQGLMLAAMQAAILGVALWLWRHGRVSVGDIAFALTMFFILQGYLHDIGMHIRNLQRSVNDMEELVALEGEPLGIEDKPGAPPIFIRQGEIRFDKVTFRYGAHATPLYTDFSIQIAPGERIGLVGHSGSGKTTFIKLVQRLYDVSVGRILIDGQDLAEVQQASLRQQIAIVQQEPLLFHRSLAENIAYAKPGAPAVEIERAARLASAHDFIADLPQGYATLVGERGVKLSGGERQRIAIARAFLADAPLLILDEATSSLDSESETLIQQAMARLMQGRTTLVIAHRLSTVRSLDRLLVMERGRVIEEGSHDVLIQRKNGAYRQMFERQSLADGAMLDGVTAL